MSSEREKEREVELESSMYTNCLFLGLDPAIIGRSSSGGKAGNFRHSNPRMGEQLLYFLLSSLRGPAQSSKDFDKVWPVFDSAQSRDFRKIVQVIISELESQGALLRSNSTVSSLATCCGPRFVELLWQISVHALREVHKRNFASDVASNPLPLSLTEVSYLHAASILPVTKAKIALQRRKFLTNANTAVQRQTSWSNLATKITAEFRSLCAEEAYLQQESEKLQDMRNKAELDKESWDDQISSSSVQNSHLVSKATHLWESLLARKSQHEVLASGPIEDLIAQREHRYRISGTSLIAAMDLSPHLPTQLDNQKKMNLHQLQGNTEVLSIIEDRNGRAHQTVDVAEILRCWTHALQRIHRHTFYLAKANDGEGPELLRCASNDCTSGHAESLAATLAEHHQHLASIQELINQLNEAVPAMQKSITELTEEVNCIAPSKIDEHTAISSSSIHAQISGRSLENIDDAQPEKASRSPALKLPQLFNVTSNSSGKITNAQKRHVVISKPVQTETLAASKPIDPPFTNIHSTTQVAGLMLWEGQDNMFPSVMDHDSDTASNRTHSQKLRRSVREAALSKSVNDTECTENKSSKDGSEHFFTPPSTGTITPNKRNESLPASSPLQVHVNKSREHQFLNREGEIISVSLSSNELSGIPEYQAPVNAYDFRELDNLVDEVFSPPMLIDSSSFQDSYEDLLAPLSDSEAALMEQ